MNQKCPMLKPTKNLPCIHYIQSLRSTDPGFCKLSTMFRCIEAIKHKLPAISYRSASDFIRCKLRYKRRVVEGLHVRPTHLPETIKLSQAWNSFIRHQHEEEYSYNDGNEHLLLTKFQEAKITAMIRAYRDLDIKSDTDGLLGCHYEINVPIGQQRIFGCIDRAYEDHIVVTKLSAKPDFYTYKENVDFQVGTYLMIDERFEYVDVKITRLPSLQTGRGKYQEESMEDYEERLYGDIVSRPASYFLGLNRKNRTYGIRFWRSEFDLKVILLSYVHIIREIKDTIKHQSWYPNHLACHVPTPCEYLPIKRSGVVSEELFTQQLRPENDRN